MRSILSYLGGKSLLRKEIISRFPSHVCYVEAFAGGAWVLFAKEPSKVEVLNDINSDLINFYQVVKCCPQELIVELQWDLVSRELFNKYKKELQEEELTPVQRAKRFYYILKASFGGQGTTFGYSTTSKPKLNLMEFEKIVMEAHQRLKRVIIENLDYKEIIKRYDREHTLFYLDPPYRMPSSKAYVQYFTDEDYIALKEVLSKIKGKFILSLNDDPFLRKLFRHFKIEEVCTQYSISKATVKKVRELIIRNF